MTLLDKLEKLEQGATPGKWDEASWQLGQINYADAAFIAAARTFMPKLLAVARQMEAIANGIIVEVPFSYHGSCEADAIFNIRKDALAALAQLRSVE